ncbi:Ser/Thr protein phosphatase [Tritrichomonas foetus]|uniref:Serine/threonine-protein phosphatase n=1 Tax=Tritrichomonas foetus TaxID=1144522 RepID=A0A1J4J5D1_9EUKA|nr:Ser/Thr protein phosphatase [Tritrichomonas foetus]|eukprot:OHS94456.1 Ser/Thr protein phosphatase [Tritrichomonas foetus]
MVTKMSFERKQLNFHYFKFMTEGINEVVDFVLSGFRALLHSAQNSLSGIGIDVPIPSFDATTIIKLCHYDIQILQKQKTLLQIEPPIVVVGDLHGSFHDLLRVFSIFKEPPQTKYIFLGDYVDRGPFSLEVVVMLIAFQCAYPSHVYLIRGNHEISNVNSQYGFKMDIVLIYGFDDVWRSFQKVFDWLPLGAVIGKDLFCVHGGISPLLQDVSQILEIQRPISDPEDPLIQDLMWSDPSTNFLEFSESTRGVGSTFGANAIKSFIQSSGMRWIIRAHQCVDEGISVFPNGPVITVFSSSNYGTSNQNKSGVLVINEKNELEPIRLPALRKLKREETCFFSMTKTYQRQSERTTLHAMNPAFDQQMNFLHRKTTNNIPAMQQCTRLVPKVYPMIRRITHTTLMSPKVQAKSFSFMEEF